jgi:ankyrin repeat protein
MGSPPPHRRPASELPPLPRDPLFRAAYLGDRSALLTLLYEGANPNARDKKYRGTRLLQYAVIGGHVETVEMLISNGAQIEAVGLFNVTPLVTALWFRQTAVVCALVRRGAQVDTIGPQGRRPLMSAAEAGDLESVRALVEAGATVNAYDTDPFGGSVLQCAAGFGHREVAGYLLEHGADVNLVHPLPPCQTALMSAASRGYVEVVQDLIAYGADIHVAGTSPCSYGATALTWAALDGFREAADVLVAAGARPELKEAVLLGDPVQTERWLQTGQDPDTLLPFAETLLMAAAERGHAGVARVLIAHGASLHYARRSVLATAAEGGHLEVVRLLLDAGAEVNRESEAEEGRTALMAAALEDRIEVARFLLEQGADAEMRNYFGQSAEDIAGPNVKALLRAARR